MTVTRRVKDINETSSHWIKVCVHMWISEISRDDRFSPFLHNSVTKHSMCFQSPDWRHRAHLGRRRVRPPRLHRRRPADLQGPPPRQHGCHRARSVRPAPVFVPQPVQPGLESGGSSGVDGGPRSRQTLPASVADAARDPRHQLRRRDRPDG